jgi:hypothetical protein
MPELIPLVTLENRALALLLLLAELVIRRTG